MNKTIDDFIGGEDPIVNIAARTVKKLKEALDAGRLTHTEFDELVDDALTLGKIQESMISLDRKQRIVDAFKQITAVIGLTKLL